MADDATPTDGAGPEAHPPSRQSQPAPEPGLIDQVSNALDAAQQALETPNPWMQAQEERVEKAVDEAIASHFDSGLPPWDSSLEGSVGISASATPGAPPAPNPAFGTGETHPTPAPQPGIIDEVSYTLDAAGDAVTAPNRWLNAQMERAAESAMNAVVSHLDPGAPPLTPGLAGSVGIGTDASFGQRTDNPGFGTGETHPAPAPDPWMPGGANAFGPTGAIDGVDVSGGYGVGSGVGDIPTTTDSTFDHVPHDNPGSVDPFDGISADTPISTGLDAEPMHVDPAPTPEPSSAPVSAPPPYDPAKQTEPC